MAEPKKDNKTGKWTLRIRYKDPVTNQWKGKMFTGKTRKECKNKETDFNSKLLKNENIEDIGLVAFYITWMETFKRGKISDSRMNKIEIVKGHLETFFGTSQTLKGVNKINYQKFVNWLGRAKPSGLGLSTQTVSDRHCIVKSMFLEALDMGYITINPTRKINVTGQTHVPVCAKTLSFEDMVKFKNVLVDYDEITVKYFLLTQMFTGARYQEVAALTWDDVLYDTQQINIDKAYEFVKNKKFKDPKSSAGYRKIDVNEQLLHLLKKHKAKQNELILAKKLKNKFNLVFVNERDGWPLSNSYVNRIIKEICETAEVDRISSHGFRHARTDYFILSGADPIYVKDQLGHENISTTLKHYAQMNEDLRIKNKAILKEYFEDII